MHDPLADLLHEAAEPFGASVKLFRPWRDTRFANDKRPLKEMTGGYVVPQSGGPPLALYVAMSANGFYAATGLYEPAKDQLARLREGIADNRAGPRLPQRLRLHAPQGWKSAATRSPPRRAITLGPICSV